MADRKVSYGDLNEELNNILVQLQSSELEIDDAIKTYERGMKILKELEDYLKNAENKVKKIKEDFSQPAS